MVTLNEQLRRQLITNNNIVMLMVIKRKSSLKNVCSTESTVFHKVRNQLVPNLIKVQIRTRLVYLPAPRFLLLLLYNCFTMFSWFLLYNEVNQLYTHIYPLPPGPRSYPSRSSQHIQPRFLRSVPTSCLVFFWPCCFNDLNTVMLRRNIFSMADKTEDQKWKLDA